MGSTENPNWLPSSWEAVFLTENLHTSFLKNISCETGDVFECCKALNYRYAWVPIWIEYISNERAGAEYLASKWHISVKSFNPHEYKLEEHITRKEIMKIIMNISDVGVADQCREVFADVENDWGCKYIESALDNQYISANEWFRPNDPVTRSEALKLIFKARSIEKKYDTDSWQEDYISSAYYLWYIDQKFLDYNTYATRWWIFSLSARTYNDFKN